MSLTDNEATAIVALTRIVDLHANGAAGDCRLCGVRDCETWNIADVALAMLLLP